MLLNLLRKDLINLRKVSLILLAYAVIFSFSFFPSSGNSMFLGTIIPMMAMILVTGYDVRNRNYLFIYSLPVRRKDIVTTNYVEAILFGIGGILLGFVGGAFISLFTDIADPAAFSLPQIMLTLSAFYLTTSLYLPLFYWLGPKGTRFVNVAFVLILMSIGGSISFLQETSTNVFTFSSGAIIFTVFAASIVIMAISYSISLTIFNRKDI